MAAGLKRKAMDELLAWKKVKTKQALLVAGARQVGKTFLIRQFAHEQYKHVIEINLIETPEARTAFERATDASSIMLRISAYATEDLVPGETVIFIDEVQECKELVTALKFLVDRYGEHYDFVFSGSLLGIELRSIRSQPVGYLSVIEMFPLDFEEFCWANGVSSLVIDEARAAFEQRRPVDEVVDSRLNDLFHSYLVVGGMPDAVSGFTGHADMQLVQRVQGDILNLYRYDISKYAGDRARVVRRVFDLIPAELNTQGKRFVISHIEGESRFNRYDNAFMWLVDAGVALLTCNVTEPRYPLELSVDISYFKLFMSDIGLLSCACGMEVVRDVLAGRLDINYGSMFENYVAQEFVAHGLASSPPERHLYFFRSRKMGELDFLVEMPRGHVLPLEVKSGKSYRRHSALSRALRTENYGFTEAVVLHEGNVETDGPILYLPMYMTMFLHR